MKEVDIVEEIRAMEYCGYRKCLNCYEYFPKERGDFCSDECKVKYLIERDGLSIGKHHTLMTREEMKRYARFVEYI